jgi:hypothetical protein
MEGSLIPKKALQHNETTQNMAPKVKMEGPTYSSRGKNWPNMTMKMMMMMMMMMSLQICLLLSICY